MKTQLGIENHTGLSSTEASRRLVTEGCNEIPSAARRNTFAIAISVAGEPMFLLLFASATIYLVLGDVREAAVLFASVLVILAITIFQERKMVRSDILILSDRDRVPADATVLSCNDPLVDESLLSGESVPMRKIAWDGVAPVTRPGGDDLPFVYSGTLLVQGRGLARISATGMHTEFGKIGEALQPVATDETFLQKKSARLVQTFAAVGLSLCALAVVLYSLTRDNRINGLLVDIALVMALLPEEIPVV